MGETHYRSLKKWNNYNGVCLASQLEKNTDIMGERYEYSVVKRANNFLIGPNTLYMGGKYTK